MSETKPPRLPACARGTDHRIDCVDHYWVRLVTRRAMQAEGECLQNCLRHGSYHDHAGPDDLTDSALWSLRRAEDAVSIALAIRYDPATSHRGMLPDGLLYSTAYGGPDSGQTRIATAFDGREVTAFEVYLDGRVRLEFALRQMVEIRSKELTGRPVIASYPLPPGPGGALEARIVSDNRVDDWRGAVP